MPKLLRTAGLGGLIWSASLIWPEINLVLSWPVLWAAWLVTAILFYLANRQSAGYPIAYRHERPPSRPSRPVPLLRI